MNSKEFGNMLKRFLEGEATQDEKEKVLSWYENIPIKEKEGMLEADRLKLENKIWSKLQVDLQPSKSKRVLFRDLGEFSVVAKIAATVLLLIGITSVIVIVNRNSSSSEIANTADTIAMLSVVNTDQATRIVELEDGSRVTLHPHSELKYPSHFEKGHREVELVGEGFFEIYRDTTRPFLVHTRDVVTKVLGTSFTIKAYNDMKEISVAVRTGKVMVYHPKNLEKQVFLTPNQEVVYDTESQETSVGLVEKPQIVEVVPSLKMSYTNAPVVEIVEAIEKAYGIDIQFNKETLEKCTITTVLDNEDLYERIQVICHALGARYSVENMAIIIESKGCQ